MKKKKKYKIKWKSLTFIIMILISISCLCISGYQILAWKQDNKNTEKIIEKIDEKAIIEETDTGKIIEPEKVVDKDNPYWDFIKMNLINVNFKNL